MIDRIVADVFRLAVVAFCTLAFGIWMLRAWLEST